MSTLAVHSFDRSSVLNNVECAAGLYAIGYLQGSRLFPMYVGRSGGVRKRLLRHLRRSDWDKHRSCLTHFTVSYIDDAEKNFEAEAWHFHRYDLPLNNVHPALPCGSGSTIVCPQEGCYHQHIPAAVTMMVVLLHAHGRLKEEGFFALDWDKWRRTAATAQWGFSPEIYHVFDDLLTEPLRKPVRLTAMNTSESLKILYKTFMTQKAILLKARRDIFRSLLR